MYEIFKTLEEDEAKDFKSAVITLFLRGRCYLYIVVFIFSFGFVLNCSSIPFACAELVAYFRPSINIFLKVYVGSCKAFFRNLEEVPFVTVFIFISECASAKSQCFAKPRKRV